MRVREHAHKRLPYADFFGYFLVRRQESDMSSLQAARQTEICRTPQREVVAPATFFCAVIAK